MNYSIDTTAIATCQHLYNDSNIYEVEQGQSHLHTIIAMLVTQQWQHDIYRVMVTYTHGT